MLNVELSLFPLSGAILSLLIALFLPGSIFALFLFEAPTAHSFVKRLIVCPALSVGLLGLIYLWTTTLHGAMTPLLLRLCFALCAFLLLLIIWRKHATSTEKNHSFSANDYRLSALIGLCALGLLLVIIQTRWSQMRSLVAPPWVDSLHHALLIRVAAERGQIPIDLRPYLPVEQLAYHWGYHVTSAAAIGLAGNTIPDTLPNVMLWHQLALQILVPLMGAGLALVLWRRSLAGLAALALVGVGSIMPAFYLSWGRLTLLLAMVLLPGVLLLAYQTVRYPTWRISLALALALTGLSLTHLALFVFALGWCLAVWIVWLPMLIAKGWRQSIRSTLALAGSAILTALLQAPWLLILLERARPGAGASALHVAGNSSYNALPTALLWAIGNDWMLALAALAALLGLARRRHLVSMLLVWCVVAVILANPVLIGLPYLSFVTNEILVVSMFVPAALLVGGGLVLLENILVRQGPHPQPVSRMRERGLISQQAMYLSSIVALALLLFGLWRMPAFQTVVREDTILLSADEREAIRWVATDTPTNARFLVNTTGWLGTVNRGSDGGWWLLALAGRQVSTPPVLYSYAADNAAAQIEADSAWLRDAGNVDDTTLAAFMRQHGYTHIFATQRGITLNAVRLRLSPLFEEVYANQGVSILRLR